MLALHANPGSTWAELQWNLLLSGSRLYTTQPHRIALFKAMQTTLFWVKDLGHMRYCYAKQLWDMASHTTGFIYKALFTAPDSSATHNPRVWRGHLSTLEVWSMCWNMYNSAFYIHCRESFFDSVLWGPGLALPLRRDNLQTCFLMKIRKSLQLIFY